MLQLELQRSCKCKRMFCMVMSMRMQAGFTAIWDIPLGPAMYLTGASCAALEQLWYRLFKANGNAAY